MPPYSYSTFLRFKLLYSVTLALNQTKNLQHSMFLQKKKMALNEINSDVVFVNNAELSTYSTIYKH